ncbi:6262_t:CDS:2 [Diversispora eburnea]|uniref:6262_t:CDS:1 n=1 Tax=Diversispora eburnea TaxID=1213867 RepID=A0A9N9G6X3_9GLOM|nr:6262_t:CDS:2 [Diversispora eburnea]
MTVKENTSFSNLPFCLRSLPIFVLEKPICRLEKKGKLTTLTSTTSFSLTATTTRIQQNFVRTNLIYSKALVLRTTVIFRPKALDICLSANGLSADLERMRMKNLGPFYSPPKNLNCTRGIFCTGRILCLDWLKVIIIIEYLYIVPGYIS